MVNGSGRAGTVVVWGLMGHVPFGGMAWQVIHYLAGLRAAGLDVWYVEDTDQRLLDLGTRDWAVDIGPNASFINDQLAQYGLGDRWVLRAPRSRECWGALDWDGLLRLYRDSDLVINLCASHEIQPHHDAIRRLVLVETDPGGLAVGAAVGDDHVLARLARHDALVTYATNIGGEGCLLPTADLRWLTSVPPVSLTAWGATSGPTRHAFTTVMNWSPPSSVVEWRDQRWEWSKRAAMDRIAPVPRRCRATMEIALRGADEGTRASLRDAGWSVARASDLDAPAAYRDYIRSSLGEFSIAKEQYVAPRTGWISDRTVCYLAAGRPAVVERTHIAGIPIGLGLVDFADVDEAVAAVDEVQGHYDEHSAAARELAREHFAADKVVARMLSDLGVSG